MTWITQVTMRLDEVDQWNRPCGEPRWVRGLARLLLTTNDAVADPPVFAVHAIAGPPVFEVHWIADEVGTYYTISREGPA